VILGVLRQHASVEKESAGLTRFANALRFSVKASDGCHSETEIGMFCLPRHALARTLVVILALALAACGNKASTAPEASPPLAAKAPEAMSPPPPPDQDSGANPAGVEQERYLAIQEGGVVAAAEQPFSTFSIDVDTGAYANVRRFLNKGQLPPTDAVRVEELINYFPYRYAEPQRNARGERPPFGVTTELAATPWNRDSLLLRVGIKAFDQPQAALPPCNLVFLVDVSGSMNEPNKLPLLKGALHLFVSKLRPQDRISLVTYASGTAIALPPTSGGNKASLFRAIDSLQASGSTAGSDGLELAYKVAGQGFIRGGINRILLATDGDFNVGISDFEQLKNFISEKRKSGVSLSTLGFGEGNYREDLMKQLADSGDGNYSYIDTLNEAQKVLVDQISSTLSILARDVKVQMEFNPKVVAEYRLIGYENRRLAREDFRNDKVDAGEIGAGHCVTALYEISLVGKRGLLGALRYASSVKSSALHADELGLLHLRYQTPDNRRANEITHIVKSSVQAASEDLRFAAAVAAFGQQLRGGKYLGNFGYAQIAELAAGARGEDAFAYRREFIDLVARAQALSTPGNPINECPPNDHCLPGSPEPAGW
jgi:Ca-activated chloride channel family protein